jgi:hypothetical protein
VLHPEADQAPEGWQSLEDVSMELFAYRMLLAVVTEAARRLHEPRLTDSERAHRFAIYEDARDDAADAEIPQAKIDAAAVLGINLTALTVEVTRKRTTGFDWNLIGRSQRVRELIDAAYQAGALPGQVDDALAAADRNRQVTK